jgi:anti-sigma B factor antagonist
MITRSSLQPELDCELVAFYGELDAAAAPDLRERLNEVVASGAGGLLIDLCNCTFIDSLGVAAVVDAARGLLDQDREVALVAHGPQVRRILGLTGVEELIDLYWTRDEATEALAEGRLGS